MKKTLLSMLMIASCFSVANAQLMVDENGRVGVGIETNVNYQTDSNEVIVCVSRHNHIPYITNANNLVYIQNETINDNRVYSGNTIKVGRNVTSKKTSGDVIINSGNVNMVGNRVELQAGTKVSKGAVLKINTPL